MRVQTHQDLKQIDGSIISGFGVANKHLENIDTNIFYGFQGTHNLLSNIHHELSEWHKETGISNQYLHYASEMLGNINEGI